MSIAKKLSAARLEVLHLGRAEASARAAGSPVGGAYNQAAQAAWDLVLALEALQRAEERYWELANEASKIFWRLDAVNPESRAVVTALVEEHKRASAAREAANKARDEAAATADKAEVLSQRTTQAALEAWLKSMK